MCSVDDVSERAGRLQLDAASEREVSKICMKCGTTAASVVIRSVDSFCKNCFLSYCSHKFRASFGKSKVIRDGEQVLVAFSGGAASSAMLHLVQEGKSCRAQKKLRFSPLIAFVDEGAVLGLTSDQRAEQNEAIYKLMTASGYPSYILPLEEVMAGPSTSVESMLGVFRCSDITNARNFDRLSANTTALQHLMNGTQSLTSKEYLLKNLRCQLLTAMARHLNCSKIITAETGTRTAVNMLTGIALGKGGHIPFDAALIDRRNEDAVVVRPMRDFTSKEIVMYNVYHSVQSYFIPTLVTKADEGASLESLTESFVVGLQSNFPATVSTVVRTGDKLVDFASTRKHLGCSFVDSCDPIGEPSAESIAIQDQQCTQHLCEGKSRFSCSLCQAPTDDVMPGVNGCPASAAGEQHKSSRSIASDGLCYACRRTFDDMESPESVLRIVQS